MHYVILLINFIWTEANPRIEISRFRPMKLVNKGYKNLGKARRDVLRAGVNSQFNRAFARRDFIEKRCDIRNFEIKTALLSHLAENQYQPRKHVG